MISSDLPCFLLLDCAYYFGRINFFSQGFMNVGAVCFEVPSDSV